MPVVFSQELATTYETNQEWLFSPMAAVTIQVTNGPAAATFMLYENKNIPYNGQSYESVERPMTLAGNYVWSPEDFDGSKICGVKVRSTIATQLAVISLSA